ncbi:MAG: hypothetical protein AAF616_08760, partial [Bacteroidota bacterium]
KLFIFSSSILFLSFIVAWLLLKLPEMIIPEIYNAASIIIIISSVLLIISQVNIRKDQIEKALWLTGASLLFGLFFSLLQVLGWNELLDSNAAFRNILLPFSLVHFVHVSVGIILLISVFKKIRKYRVHSKARNYAANVYLFWHFLGIIWLVFVGAG